MNNLDIPDSLSDFGKQIATAIIATATEVLGKPPHASCRVFYSPEEWKAKGEDYGLTSQLVVVYDGCDLLSFFDFEDGKEALMARMEQALRALGVYSEPCTCWYSAIYRHHGND
jgi:hypothetical protein